MADSAFPLSSAYKTRIFPEIYVDTPIFFSTNNRAFKIENLYSRFIVYLKVCSSLEHAKSAFVHFCS